MKPLFISYDLALILKDKGFNEPCFGIYTNEVNELWSRLSGYEYGEATNASIIKNYKDSKYCTAPTYQQVVDWFRDVHKISISLKHYPSGSFGYDIQKHNNDATGWTKLTSFMGKTEYTYYQNYDNAINEALKLI